MSLAQIEKWKARDYSWSQHSSFLWNPPDWHSKYILELPQRDSAELRFGKLFADSCEARDPIAPVTLLSKVEHAFKENHDDITLIGYADTIDDTTFKHIGEFKTGVKAWDQKRVDEHGQITFYCLLNFLQNKVPPQDVKLFLEWVPTRKLHNKDGFTYEIIFRDFDPVPVHFETTRTMRDVLRLGREIRETRKLMEEYALSKL